eukprot:gene9187-19049_t
MEIIRVFVLFLLLDFVLPSGPSLFPQIIFSSLSTTSQPEQQNNVPIDVVKKDGRVQPLISNKIIDRLQRLCVGLDLKFVDPMVVTDRVVKGLYNKVTTLELDNLIAETAAYMSTEHSDYAKLAARISISNLQNNSLNSFSDTIEILYNYIDPKTNEPAGLIAKNVYDVISKNSQLIDNYIDHSRDFNFDYFGFKTLEKSYLFRINGTIVERPQYLFMRVAIGIHGEDLQAAFETYDLMSNKYCIHASPTLFHAGTPEPQMSSCFLLSILDDSIDGIYQTLRQCALISKSAGGIGLAVHSIRAKGTYIKGTRGVSNGLVPMLRVFDATARYVDQGGGKRPGAFAVYIEPWHADVFEILDLRKNTGKEEARARDLFYGLWIPDLFMKRVEADGDWSLMCPHECPGLADCWGEAFDSLYTQYERDGKARKTIKARELWYAILDAQIETGTPYMLYKDACNSKSNQKNLGTIKCSNLCTEIVEYTAPDEVAVCNLASIVLPRFVEEYKEAEDSSSVDPLMTDGNESKNSKNKKNIIDKYTGIDGKVYIFNLDKLAAVARVLTLNLNKIIDKNFYPILEARNSNFRHRPIGLGVQGLADAFQLMRLAFDCNEARRLNKDIFETIYYAALNASCDLAKEEGAYASYAGSPASQGILQHDMWGVEQSSRWDWPGLRLRIATFGLRNSLLLAPMPTASTAQILGYNECFEPYTSNLYVRRVRAGEFIIVNPHLLKDLVSLGIWNQDIRNRIIADSGSIQHIPDISPMLKDIYRTVWEIKQRSLIDMAADRGAFIDQSQSLNAFVPEPDYGKLTSMHFHAWKRGLKTGMYYLRTKAATQAIQFTIDPSVKSNNNNNINQNSNSRDLNNDNDDNGSNGGSSSGGGGDIVYGEACISCSG